tara:strand:+ start:35 stop:493 length:459 start_codon:yes stop_codon:yes gene_type:complete
MQKLFENWRKFITEADTDNDGIEDERELAIIDKGELGPVDPEGGSIAPGVERDGDQISIDLNVVRNIVGENGDDGDFIEMLRDHNIYPDGDELRVQAMSGIPMDNFPRAGEKATGELVLMFKPDPITDETPEQHARRMEEVEANLKDMLGTI